MTQGQVVNSIAIGTGAPRDAGKGGGMGQIATDVVMPGTPPSERLQSV